MAQRKKLNPIASVFILTTVMLVLTFLILWGLGFRYVNDRDNALKFVGKYRDGQAVSGKIYYDDGRVATLNSETKTIVFEDGEKYVGGLKGYLPHGKGTLTTFDKNILDGDFLDGKCSGIASITYKNGDVYVGEVKEGKRSGRGEYFSNDGTVYKGNFADDLKHGIGMTVFTDNSVYIGEYQNSLKNGWGAYLFDCGDVYVGSFKDDTRTGKGIYIWAVSEEYSSEFDTIFSVELNEDFCATFLEYFENDFARHFTYPVTTEASTQNPLFTGLEKVLSRGQIETYAGDFLDTELSGSGIYKWTSGRVFEGDAETLKNNAN